MPHYFAFLRAINVGGHTVKMDHLRSLFEALGCTNVATFIASGNVIFDSPVGTPAEDPQALEAQIEQHLKQALGYQVTTFLRSITELAAIATYRPFEEPLAAGHALSIAFLKSAPPETTRQKLLGLQTEFDAFHIHQREVYWLCLTRFSDSPFSGALFEKTLGMPATVRNVTTVRKLGAKVVDAK